MMKAVAGKWWEISHHGSQALSNAHHDMHKWPQPYIEAVFQRTHAEHDMCPVPLTVLCWCPDGSWHVSVLWSSARLIGFSGGSSKRSAVRRPWRGSRRTCSMHK